MAERQSQQDPTGPSSENEEGQKPHRWENPPKTVESLAREAIHRVAASKAGGDDAPIEPAAKVLLQDFISALLTGDADFGLALIEGYRRKGRSYRFIAETLFAEAARKLGAEWESDGLSFVDVSVGTSTLLTLNSMTRQRFGRRNLGSNGQVIFATLPNQAHTFGAVIAAEAFRQEDFDVELMLASEADSILEVARHKGVRLVGLTAGRQGRLPEILALAKRLKALPAPPAILLGGSAATTWSFTLQEGAIDCIAKDLNEALDFAHGVQGNSY